jgi:hypothetical protein
VGLFSYICYRMARNRTNPAPQKPNIGNILALSRYNNTTVLPNAAKFDDKLPIIPFFKEDGNNFIGTITEMYNRSAMHKACILIKHVLACGDGIIINRKDGQPYTGNAELEAFLDEVNDYGETANDVITKQLFDEILTQMHSLKITLEVIGEGEEALLNKENISITHNDISTFRLGKPIDKKLIECYLSYCWATDLVKYDTKKMNEVAEKLPLFIGQDVAESVIFSTAYETGRYYYSIPDYFTLEFKRWADISYAIPTYNHSRIENQFRPSGMITFVGRPPEGMEPADFAEEVQRRFTGEGNNSSILINMVEQKEQAPSVEIFNDAPEGIFESLSTLATESVLRGHRMHPSILMATAGSLGQANELKTIFDLFYKNVIEGYQKRVLKSWDKILDYAGFGEYTLDIANNNPISLLGNIDLSNVLSVNEIRTELGYEELEDKQSEKTLADKLGSENVRLMQGYLTDANLTTEQKRAVLKTLFSLGEIDINNILPLPNPTI